MRENIVRITTHDTKKTYEFPSGKTKNIPNLWEVEMKISAVDWLGRSDFNYRYTTKRICLERETLLSHGLTGEIKDKEGKVIEPPKTPEDLILELLEIVGVYPTEA